MAFTKSTMFSHVDIKGLFLTRLFCAQVYKFQPKVASVLNTQGQSRACIRSVMSGCLLSSRLSASLRVSASPLLWRSIHGGRDQRPHSSSICCCSCHRSQKIKSLTHPINSGTLVRTMANDPAPAKENIKTVPNLLTALRMGSAPILSYLVLSQQFPLALGIFTVAGLTDMLDGYIARNYKGQRTAFGTALDPLADKVLMSFLTVSLTYAGLIPAPMTALILGRDAGLVLGGVYIRYTSLPPPKTLSRYFDASLVTVKLYPSLISKVNTMFQMTFVTLALASTVFDFVGHPWLQAFMYTTAVTTILSGADYVLTWRRRLKVV